MLTLLVDADACPVKEEVYRVAKRYGLTVILVSDSFMRVPREEWLELVVVKHQGQLDAADDWIAKRAEAGDIVITEDILLASRCLHAGARVMNSRGRVFTSESIGEAVALRELMAGLREAGSITGGPPPFAKADRSKFLQRLDELVHSVRRESAEGRS